MLKDIYVIGGKYENNMLTLKRNDKNEIPINLDIEQKGFTWYYDNLGEQLTTPQDDPIVDPDPINPDPQDPPVVDPDPVDPNPQDPDPVDPDPQNPDPIDPDPLDPNPTDPTHNIYNVRVHINNDEWGSVQYPAQVEEGGTCYINVIPNAGYDILGWYTMRGNVKTLILGSSSTIYDVRCDIDVYVTFNEIGSLQQTNEYTVSLQGVAGEYGIVGGRWQFDHKTFYQDIRITKTVQSGLSIVLYFYASSGYTLDWLKINDELVTVTTTDAYASQYTILNVESDITAIVKFKKTN